MHLKQPFTCRETHKLLLVLSDIELNTWTVNTLNLNPQNEIQMCSIQLIQCEWLYCQEGEKVKTEAEQKKNIGSTLELYSG